MQIATFVIAVAGWVTAALALGWNIASWLLTGGRGRVELAVGFVERLSTRYVLFPLSRGGIDQARREMQRNSVDGDLAYFITVRNVGRTALTVRSVQFRAETREAFGTLGGGDWGAKLPARVETGDSITIGMNAVWLHEMGALVRRKHSLAAATLRGEADLGTGKTVISKHRLVIHDDPD
ncbi:hypothetical protein [Crossiella cryophila]|uniref:Uncharacterized protein n=1 Tax=Crossiella cryophila TaxID=43355 RepID=A0A7W7FUK8_9PSEU|nr:hypothetical protein [Crossiella cryophila]MBB4679416.1 hypothetical protein [Crossiella cryophila]